MKKIAILIEDIFDEKELIYPYYRLLEEGYEVHLVGTEKNKAYKGKTDFTMTSSHSSRDVKPSDYEAVIIPGGFSPDYMRRSQATVNFVREMNKQDKIIGAICHGPWMIASTVNLKGRNITSFYAIKDDLINAGANYLDQEVVVDRNLITSRTPNDLPIFLKTIIEELNK